MKYFSTFSGIGGFEIGIHNAFKTTRKIQRGSIEHRSDHNDQRLSQQPFCVGYSEIDKYASSVYEYHNPGAKNYGDITKIDTEELPDFDVLVGGFPCQAFSVAGKRRGFEDTRGTLFFDLARILRAKTPRLFVFENVKGLLSHDDGRTFKTIITTLNELGYDCQWQVLNSKNNGVPQNRERIYIVGHLRGTSRPEVFPLTGAYGETAESRSRDKIAIPVLTPDRIVKRQNGRRFKTDGEPAFTVNTIDRHGVMVSYNRNDGVGKELNVAHTLSASDYRGLNRNQAQNAVIEATGINWPSRGPEPRPDNLAATLKSGESGTKNRILLDGSQARIRRLTPIECERLQGFPDGWTAMSTNGAVSDTQRYKMCGNAVTTNVVQAVFERILR